MIGGMRSLFGSGRAETARAPACLCKLHALFDPGLDDRRYHELRDAHPARNRKIFFAMVDQQNLNFAAIVAVDRPRRIEAGNAVLQCKSGTGTDLALKPRGYLEDEARWHQDAFSGQQDDLTILGQRRPQIDAGGTCSFITRQRQPLGVGKTNQSQGRDSGRSDRRFNHALYLARQNYTVNSMQPRSRSFLLLSLRSQPDETPFIIDRRRRGW